MMVYHKSNTCRINRAVREQIEIIINILISSTSGISSIILGGGFGRGEGMIKSDGTAFQQLSDYDIFVIISERLNKGKIKEITKKLRDTLASDYPDYIKRLDADIRFIEERRMGSRIPVLRFYDLKYGSRVIWGEDARKLIPEFTKEDLPINEGFRLIFNRFCFITNWLSTDAINNQKNNTNKLIFEISKTTT